jgi:serine/threonine-protein kinase
MSAKLFNRTCPTCGADTPNQFCAMDKTQTIVARRPTKTLRTYQMGDVIGDRYRIIEPLGKGAATVVFDTQHVGTGMPVAVKLLSVDPTEDDGMVAVRRFFREARFAASLHHPNVVMVYDVGQDRDGALFLAMERLTGESLDKLLQRRLIEDKTMTEAETVAIAMIMLTVSPRGDELVKVLDFGVARAANSVLTRGGKMPGSPAYMSPEQCRGETVDGRSDLYSLACVMYTCLSCRPPFQHREPLRLMAKQIHEEPPDLRSLTETPVSDGLVALLQRCLVKSPEDRPKSALTMARALRAIANDGVAVAEPRVRHNSVTDPVVQAAALAKLAEQANEPEQALEYARSAMRIDPRNLAYRQLARRAKSSLQHAIPGAPDRED